MSIPDNLEEWLKQPTKEIKGFRDNVCAMPKVSIREDNTSSTKDINKCTYYYICRKGYWIKCT